MPILTQAEKEKILQNEQALLGKADSDHNHSGTYEPADTNIVKKNAVNNFTAVQGSGETAGANALNLTGTNYIRFTATAANITVGTMATKKGQEFSVTIDSAETATGWGTEFLFAPDFNAVTPTPPAAMTGTMEFYMKVVEVNGVDGGTANKIHVAWAQ